MCSIDFECFLLFVYLCSVSLLNYCNQTPHPYDCVSILYLRLGTKLCRKKLDSNPAPPKYDPGPHLTESATQALMESGCADLSIYFIKARIIIIMAKTILF